MTGPALGPLTLEGEFVRLEPLRRRHLAGFVTASKNLDWGWALSPLRTKGDVQERIEQARKLEVRGEGYAFAVRFKQNDRIVGGTSYFGVVPQHKRAEIGYTWYEQDLWGTVVNPECKFLLLRHAFEDWHANRVQISTDLKNVHSQKAIQKLGASFEGMLRSHSIRPDGSVRDTMMYSITSSDWPKIKPKLQSRLDVYSKTSG